MVTKLLNDQYGNAVADLNSSNAVQFMRVFLNMSDSEIVRNYSDGTEYGYLANHLGSVTGLMDNSGTLADAITYDAFGNPSQTAPSIGDRYQFDGGAYNSTTGLSRCDARWYGPALGSWITQDPLGLAGPDSNLYRMVGNDPINETDPSGLGPPDWDPKYPPFEGQITFNDGEYWYYYNGAWHNTPPGNMPPVIPPGTPPLPRDNHRPWDQMTPEPGTQSPNLAPSKNGPYTGMGPDPTPPPRQIPPNRRSIDPETGDVSDPDAPINIEAPRPGGTTRVPNPGGGGHLGGHDHVPEDNEIRIPAPSPTPPVYGGPGGVPLNPGPRGSVIPRQPRPPRLPRGR